MNIQLSIKKSKNKQMVISFPLYYRLIFLLIALLILMSMILNQSTPLFPTIIFILSCLGALYNESWIFDNSHKTVEKRFGLLIFYRSEKIRFDMIHSVTLNNWKTFEKQDLSQKYTLINPGSYAALSLETEHKTHHIEIIKIKNKERLVKKAQKISDYCGIEFDKN